MEQGAKLSFKVNEYEGPLDLILYLIAKNQMDICDIHICDLLEQYLATIQCWESANMEIASEFLEMASRLVYIKTISLLPKQEQGEDPKAQLVGQLLEYQACKKAAALLGERNQGFSIFVRSPMTLECNSDYNRRYPSSHLARAYWEAVGKGRRKLPPQSEVFSPLVARPFISVTSRIFYILRRLYKRPTLSFEELFEVVEGRNEMVATFMAVLELLKAKRVKMRGNDQEMVFVGRNTSG